MKLNITGNIILQFLAELQRPNGVSSFPQEELLDKTNGLTLVLDTHKCQDSCWTHTRPMLDTYRFFWPGSKHYQACCGRWQLTTTPFPRYLVPQVQALNVQDGRHALVTILSEQLVFVQTKLTGNMLAQKAILERSFIARGNAIS